MTLTHLGIPAISYSHLSHAKRKNFLFLRALEVRSGNKEILALKVIGIDSACFPGLNDDS